MIIVDVSTAIDEVAGSILSISYVEMFISELDLE